MARPTKPKSSRTLYVLLALYIVASMTYYVANIAGFIDNYFDLHHRANAPFQLDTDSVRITSVRPEAKRAGLAVGDVLEKIDGLPYAGYARWLTMIRDRFHPGDKLQVTVRQPNKNIESATIRLTGRGPDGSARFREWGGLLALYGLPPLICLLVGY